MSLLDQLLELRSPTFWKRFSEMRSRPAPQITPPPSSAEALEIGFRLGLQTGYGEGLIDGVSLGLDADLLVKEPASSEIH